MKRFAAGVLVGIAIVVGVLFFWAWWMTAPFR